MPNCFLCGPLFLFNCSRELLTCRRHFRRPAFFSRSETYFGEEYPIGVSERLDLIFKELSRLSPEFAHGP